MLNKFSAHEGNIEWITGCVDGECIANADSIVANSLEDCNFSIPTLIFLDKVYNKFDIEILYKDGQQKTVIKDVFIIAHPNAPFKSSNSSHIILDNVIVSVESRRPLQPKILFSIGSEFKE